MYQLLSVRNVQQHFSSCMTRASSMPHGLQKKKRCFLVRLFFFATRVDGYNILSQPIPFKDRKKLGLYFHYMYFESLELKPFTISRAFATSFSRTCFSSIIDFICSADMMFLKFGDYPIVISSHGRPSLTTKSRHRRSGKL